MDCCLDPCRPLSYRIVVGEDYVLPFRVFDPITGQPFDCSGATEIAILLLKADGSYLTLLLSTDGVTNPSGSEGYCNAIITAAQSVLLALSAVGSLSNVEVRVTISDKITYFQFQNYVEIVQTLFPTPP